MSNRTLWILSIVLTLVLAVWQRVSGPTFPIYGSSTLAGAHFKYKLERTHAGPGDHVVLIAPGAGTEGTLEWREHVEGGDGGWTSLDMAPRSTRADLAAPIPHHGPGQKVDYRVTLRAGEETLVLPTKGVATLRFRSDVPAWVLIPHIIAMMGALMLSVRAALECTQRAPQLKFLTLRTLAALFVGGFLLGCMVSGYAFGQPWGGFPLGNDATDNKTLLAFLAWLVAGVAVFRMRNPRGFVIAAAVVTLLVYLVPHSVTMPR